MSEQVVSRQCQAAVYLPGITANGPPSRGRVGFNFLNPVWELDCVQETRYLWFYKWVSGAPNTPEHNKK